jgi:Tol biopolymer transport system component
MVIGLPLAHAGEGSVAAASWQLKQLAYEVQEQWVQMDVSNGSGREDEIRESRIEIRSGHGLTKKTKVEGGSSPQWSASGQKIAFLGFCNGYARCRQISVMNADGSKRKVMTRPPGEVSDFSWSPQEDKIAYVEQTLSTVPRLSTSTTILIINSDGTGGREVAKVKDSECHFTTSSAREVTSLSVHPTWSPDGSVFAFETCVGGTSAIAIADKDGDNSRVLVKSGYRGVWSTDSKRLLYLHGPTAHDPRVFICVIGLDGKEPKEVFEGDVGPLGLTWLPDGKSIAFVSMKGNTAEVSQINIDGSGLQRIVFSRKYDFTLGSPTFSPDGTRLIVAGDRCCPNVHDRKWSDADRSAVILLDLTSKQQRIIAKGLHPSVLWEPK